MRVKTHIWVSAYLRRLNALFVSAAVVRRGYADTGAVYIKVAALDGTCQVYSLQSGGSLIVEEGRAWRPAYCPSAAESEAGNYLAGQAGVDPGIWILEVEAPEGRHFLGQTGIAVPGD